MPNRPRQRSKSGFYHCYQRGVNHFDIFDDDEDRKFFIARFKKYANELGVKVYAWCLMSNHVHLLIRAEGEALSAFMRKIGSVYARHYNSRHGRSGPLFGGRFGSTCVETDEQLLTAVRYIHRNPVRHEKESLWGDFPWSSYREYVNGSSWVCDTELVLDMAGGLEPLMRFHEEERDYERHLDLDTEGPMGDDEARQRANSVLQDAGFKITIAQIGTLSRKKRDEAIALVRKVVGCSLRQLQRLTSIAYSQIRRAIESEEVDSDEMVAPKPRRDVLRCLLRSARGGEAGHSQEVDRANYGAKPRDMLRELSVSLE